MKKSKLVELNVKIELLILLGPGKLEMFKITLELMYDMRNRGEISIYVFCPNFIKFDTQQPRLEPKLYSLL